MPHHGLSDMRVLVSSKGVEVRFLASTHPVLLGDEEALRRLFTILLDNAVKAPPAGGFVHISLAPGEDTGAQTVVVTVQDSGIGIAQEHLPHIFDRFYRVSKDRSRETGGAGLGLAIAQWIVSAHAGVIQVESQIGCGSTFRVILYVPENRFHSPILQNQEHAKCMRNLPGQGSETWSWLGQVVR